jgi:hypothetical protein
MKQRTNSTASFPEAVYEFGRTSGLGVPAAEYRWRFGALEFSLMPLAGAWIILCFWAFWHLFTSPLTSFTLENLPGVVILAAIMAAGIWYFIACFRRRFSWRVYAFTNGFAYFKGRKIDVFRCEEIKHVQERITSLRGHPLLILLNGGRGNMHAYRVERADGRRVVLSDMRHGDSQAIARPILQPTDAARLALARRRYHAGEVIDFGGVKLSKQLGMIRQNKLLRWSELKEIVLKDSSVHIRGKEAGSSWEPIPASDFYDVNNFMALAGEASEQSR